MYASVISPFNDVCTSPSIRCQVRARESPVHAQCWPFRSRHGRARLCRNTPPHFARSPSDAVKCSTLAKGRGLVRVSVSALSMVQDVGRMGTIQMFWWWCTSMCSVKMAVLVAAWGATAAGEPERRVGWGVRSPGMCELV